MENFDNSLKKQLEAKDNLIKLKDEQVKTLENSLELKNDFIQTLETSINIKDEKAKTLEKTIKLKEENEIELKEEIEKLISTALDPLLLKEKVEKIKEFEKEIEILNGELSKADEELESLQIEIEKIRKSESNPTISNILESTNIHITKSEIIEKMRDVLQNALHKVMIVAPNILDLQDLHLYEVRSSVSMNIACLVNEGIDEHTELLDELLSLDNISLRNYEREDRYVLTRDGEELIFAVIGESENNHLVIHTKDSNHIRLLNSLTMEGWLASRKV